jgi:hypothetical protein
LRAKKAVKQSMGRHSGFDAFASPRNDSASQ